MIETKATATEKPTNIIPLQTIDELVFKAHKQFEVVVTSQQKFFAARLACGQTLLELRKRIEAGEAGPVKWWDWYGSRFARSRRDAERVMEIASAEDPRAAYEAERAATQDRVREIRAREGNGLAYSTPKAKGKTEEKQDPPPEVLAFTKVPKRKKAELRWDRLKLLEQGYRELTRDERYQHILDCHRVDKEL